MLRTFFFAFVLLGYAHFATANAQGTAQGAALSADACEGLVQTYAAFSRAQLRCGLQANLAPLQQQVRTCGTVLSSAQIKEQEADAAEMFDDNEKQLGHAALCKMWQDRLPSYLRK